MKSEQAETLRGRTQSPVEFYAALTMKGLALLVEDESLAFWIKLDCSTTMSTMWSAVVALLAGGIFEEDPGSRSHDRRLTNHGFVAVRKRLGYRQSDLYPVIRPARTQHVSLVIWLAFVLARVKVPDGFDKARLALARRRPHPHLHVGSIVDPLPLEDRGQVLTGKVSAGKEV